MEKINIELFQEKVLLLVLKEIAEDAVSYHLNSLGVKNGLRLCLVDVNCKSKPFVFSNLNELENYEINYPYIIFRVNYKNENGSETCIAVRVQE